VLAGGADPAGCFTRPGTGGYTAPALFHYDPAEAQRLLAEAGYPGGAGFPAVDCMLTGKEGRVVLQGEVLQQMWAQVLGVHVSLQPTEFKVYLNAIRVKNFQCVIEDWNYIDDPWDPLQLAATGNPNNDTAWSNAVYDRAYADAEQAGTDAARRAAFDVMENLIAREAPYAPLYFTNRARLVHPSVRGWRDNSVQVIDWTGLYLAP
jgi:oligopeptide transport system substrate-binding protein